MKNLPIPQRRGCSKSLLWFVLAAILLATLAVATALPRPAWANTFDPPELKLADCLSPNEILLFWSTGDDGQVEAPEGWKVERTQLDFQGLSYVQTFTFIGAEADDLLIVNQEGWIWRDTSTDRDLPYIYRVRAINADGTDTDGRTWSESVSADCFSDQANQPGLTLPVCECDGFAMFWRTWNQGRAEAPEGWKVERRHMDPEGNEVVQTFTFIGLDADALLTPDGLYWHWVDETADLNERYTYRVRAINSDGSDAEDRVWSKSVSPVRLEGPLNQPGLSVPQCRQNGVSMFWHTRNSGEDAAPDGWKVERRHWDSNGWVVRTFTFIGAQADALETYNENHWDWVDTTADPNVAYTYRVRAVNSDGYDVAGRVWSRRASAECAPAGA